MSMHNESIIYAPDGSAANYPTEQFTAEEAQIFRQYKKVLEAHHLKEALYCDHCWEHELSHGCEAHVTNQRIFVKCRCRVRFYGGATL